MALASALVLAALWAPAAFAVTPHTPGAGGATCEVCHVPHSAATSEGIFRSRGSEPTQSSTCFFCHDGTGAVGNVKTGPDSFNGTSGHRIEDVIDSAAPRDLTNSCSGCHVPHEDPATRPKLPASTVNGVNVAAAGSDWCLACHNDSQSWYALIGTYPQLAAPSRDATGYPTVGTFGGSTLYKNAAANAHVLIPEAAEPGRVAGDCLYCHTAHRGPSAYDGLDGQYRPSKPATAAADRSNGDYAALCFQCHDGDVSWVGRGAVDIKQYVTHEAADTGLMASGGHRIKSSGGTLPVNAPLPCYDCHNPHGSSRGNKSLISDEVGANLDTNSAAGVRTFCLSCHVTSDLLGWDSTSITYVAPAAGAKVEGLLRNGGANGSGPDGGYNWLRLKVTPGHQSADANSCYECHGNTYGAANSNNVHDPGSYSVALHTGTPTASTITIKGVAYGPFACSTCHNVELGPEHDKTASSSNATDCATCHPVPRSSLVPSWNRTTCAQGNCHAGTSVDPMHGTIDPDHTTTGPCSSANCHATDAAAIHAAAGGPGCPACHGPGITPTLSCGACHPSAHPNTALPPMVNHGPATDQCGSCHSTANLMGVHGDNCAKCHPTPATPATVYAGGCEQAGCHPGVHAGLSGGYHDILDHGEGSYCEDCHSRGDSECNGCHGPHELGAPITVSDARPTYNTLAYVVLTAVDQGGSGVKATYYQVDGGAIQTGNTILIPGPAVGSRSHSIEFWSVDNQYNVETHHVAYFTIVASTMADLNPPTGTMAVNNGAAWINTVSATLNSAVVDAETSVVTMRVDPGTGTYGAWVPYVISYPITLPAGNGLKTVRAQYKDYAGNLIALTDTISIETLAPTGTMTLGNGSGYSNTLIVPITSAMTDANSGMGWMSVQGGAWVPYAANATVTINSYVGTNQYIWVNYADAAWNTAYRWAYMMYDPLAPTGNVTINNGASYTVSQSVTLGSAVTDTGGSSLSQMRVDPGTGIFGAWQAYATSYPLTLPAGNGLKTVRAEYTDRAGNVLSKTYDITLGPGGSDITPPTGSINVNSGALIATSSTVTLTLSGADTGGSGLSQMRFSNDNSTWSAWQTYATSYAGWPLLAGDGSKSVYAQYRDFEGNVSASYSDAIWLDGTPPTGSVIVNGGAAYTNAVSVVLTCAAADGAGGAPGAMQMRFSNNGGASWSGWTGYATTINWTFAAGQGTKTVVAQYKDYAGNISTGTISDSIIYDITGPTGSLVVNANAATTNSATVTLTPSASDTGGAGVSEMRFSNDNVSWSAWQAYATTAPWTLSAGDGAKTVYVQYRDGALNPSVTYSDSIVLDTSTADTTPPTGTVLINTGAATTTSAAVALTLSASDTGGAGMGQMRFSNDNVSWSAWQAYATARNWTLSAGAGDKTVYVEYKDNAGNASGSFTDSITLSPIAPDSTPPTGSVTISGGALYAASSTVTLDTPAADTGGSGLSQMRFSNDNVTWTDWETYAATKTWTLAAGEGARTVYVQYNDNAGYVSSTYADGITVDGTAPSGTIIIDSGAAVTSSTSVTLTLSASDAGSGVAQMRLSNDNATWSAWETYGATKAWTITAGSGTRTVYVQYRDNAGTTSISYSDSISLLSNFTLNYSAGVGGTLSGTTTQNVLQGMSGTAVTAVPNAGQKFIGWSDGRTDNPRTDVVVYADVAATAWFTPTANYVVRFYTDSAGYVQGGQWIQGVQAGTSSAPVTATAYDTYYYAFSYWSDGTNYVYTPTIQLNNVTSNQTWTAYFTWTGTCPFLYTWDGDSFVFEADEFAAGYLGLRTSKGYRRPNPIDYHVLATTPMVKDGVLEFQLVEERDETDYIDLAKLYTVDAPANRDVYVERSQAEGVGQFTTLDAVIHTVAKNLEAPPSVRWINADRDVRDLVSVSDGDYLVLNYDRNAGYNYQTLELDLGDVSSAPMVKLVIDGRTMVPSSPEGRAYSRTFGPQVKFEVQDAVGNWVAVPTTTEILPKPPEFDRPFVMDLSNIWISDSRKVRFTYLYKTYIDSILLDTTADVPVTITELPLESAELKAHGFNFKVGMGELYDYAYGDPFQPARYRLPGYYTKFGDVTPLLGAVDDKFIIFGGGDQITMRFNPPADAWAGTRRYLYFSNGYYKTLKDDIAHTVEPLPFAAMSNFPYAATESYPTDDDHTQYRIEWNTRYESD